MLADQGADVIKIEAANGAGDRFRGHPWRPSSSWVFANRNKKSVTLNTKDPRGQQALLDICKDADVFIQNFRPGVAERIGIGYEAIKSVKDDIM
jgi:crotonobetainyl-CoA:carnitine CoA-transferase CaiB-like acyl-CoA transferase